jgi:hypothetical protein
VRWSLHPIACTHVTHEGTQTKRGPRLGRDTQQHLQRHARGTPCRDSTYGAVRVSQLLSIGCTIFVRVKLADIDIPPLVLTTQAIEVL